MKTDRINYYESCQEAEFPTWKRGKNKRDILLNLYENDPSIPLEQCAQILKISKQQVQRHRGTLICEGLITVAIMGIAFCSGAYCGLQQDKETIDEWVESSIESPTLDMVEDLKWQLNL
jgi:hypothetical protein